MKTFLCGLALSFVLTGSALAGDWTVRRSTDDFSDKKMVLAVTQSGHQYLSFACQEGSFGALVKLARLDMQLGGRQVMYRVDNHPAVAVAARQANGGGGALWFGQDAVRFARAVIAAHNRILVKNELARGSFSVKGSTEAVKKVLAACSL